MKFYITRTSHANRPCEEARPEIIQIEIAVYKKISELQDPYSTMGVAYREEIIDDPGHKRCGQTQTIITIDYQVWCIDFETLEELDEFRKKHGPIIISAPLRGDPDIPEIEIYDTYRE